MVFKYTASDLQRRTDALRALTAGQRERVAIQAAAALRRRNRTEMYNDAADSAAATLRQHRIAMDPDSIDNAKRIRRAARDLSRLGRSLQYNSIGTRSGFRSPFYFSVLTVLRDRYRELNFCIYFALVVDS